MSRSVSITLFLLLAVAVAAALWLVIISYQPLVSLQVTDKDGVTQISLRSTRINRDVQVIVQSPSRDKAAIDHAEETIWNLAMRHDFEKESTLVVLYGQVAKGAEQFMPKNAEKPRRFLNGETLYFSIRYQYDSMLSANIGQSEFEVVFVRDGSSRIKTIRP